ncbi:MAG: peptidase family protein [Thermoleophilia bacterium]|nr:peptidase family protein [Thermoleophilia bacterium]
MKLAPVLGIMAGTTALGAGVAFGAVKAAGESDGGTAASLGGMLGGNALVAGGLTGIAAGAVLGRVGALKPYVGGIKGMLLMPAGIAGAAAGGMLARRSLEAAHKDEYAEQLRFIDSTMQETQQVLRDAGASETVLARVPESYDRSFFNARYAPPRGPFGDDIKVGRNAEDGMPLAVDDVIAHEFTHKVIHEYAPELLGRKGDALAIHESVADTIAMVVDPDDWTVGEDSFPGGLRSFSNPEVRGAYSGGTEKPAPITREQLGSGTEAHLGAGVGNKAAWRIGEALGRDVMAKIYVGALERRELGSGATYADLARVTRAAAVQLYGAGSHEATVVDDSWTTAGY